MPDIFDEIGEDYGADVQASIEKIWTTIYRGWCSDFFDLTTDEAQACLGVYLEPGECLSANEIYSLELFEAPSRSGGHPIGVSQI